MSWIMGDEAGKFVQSTHRKNGCLLTCKKSTRLAYSKPSGLLASEYKMGGGLVSHSADLQGMPSSLVTSQEEKCEPEEVPRHSIISTESQTTQVVRILPGKSH